MIRRIRAWFAWISSGWYVFLEPPVSPEELTKNLSKASIPAFGFYFLLTLAAIIATLGLLANSAATIIGAMIIAPLMGPIVTVAYSLILANYQLLRRASLTLFTGVLVVIAIAYITTLLIGSQVAGEEILSRIHPTLLDLGVAIAAGGAGAFALTRKSIATALPGVAISVALVPPLCVTGIGLALGGDFSVGLLTTGNSSLVSGSFYLFLTNLLGIIVSGSFVFLSQPYGRVRSALTRISLPLLALLLLSNPLYFALNQLLLKNKIHHQLQAIQLSQPELFEDVGGYSLNVESCGWPYTICGGEDAKSVSHDDYVAIDLIAPVGFMDNAKFRQFQNSLSTTVGKPMKLRIRVVPTDVFEANVE